MNILASLAPIALYLIVLKAMDAFSFARIRNLVTCFLWGTVSVLVVLEISTAVKYFNHGESWHALWISPLIEETVKVVPLLILICRRRIVFLAEALIYGQMIGGGFSMAENILYLSASPDMLIGTALVRGCGTSLLHMGCTALIAAQALYPLLMNRTSFYHVRLAIGLIFSFIPSVGIHTLYNCQYFSSLTLLMLVVVVFLGLFHVLSMLNERVVVKWLDRDMNDDIALLASLKDGSFVDSPTGKYLASIRERFEPLVFFDMCAYLELYLQLLVAAKSRVLLHEAGLDKELTEKERKDYKEQITEFHTLSGNIPAMGHYMLRPIINVSANDSWAIRHLTR